MEHRELKAHVRRLITLEETESPVVSCYVSLELGQRGYRSALQKRAQVLRYATDPRMTVVPHETAYNTH